MNILKSFKNGLSNLTKGLLFNNANTPAISCNLNQTRTRISCSKNAGKEKSVKTAMHRYFRIDKFLWIRPHPGYHHLQYKKPLEMRKLQQQSFLLHKHQAKMLERMAGRYFKRLKINYFVDKPFTLYHSYMKRIGLRSGAQNVPKFFP